MTRREPKPQAPWCPCTYTTRFPGTSDQCPDCGRIVYTRADGTCKRHRKPSR